MCFSITLAGPAEEWWKWLKTGSIQSWSGLQSAFRKQCVATQNLDIEVNALANIKKHPTETFKNYIQRFTEEASTTKVDDGQHLVVLQSRIKGRSTLWDDMQRSKATTFEEFIRKAQGFINWEEARIQAFRWQPSPQSTAQTLSGYGAQYGVEPIGYSAAPGGAQPSQTRADEASFNPSQGKRSGKAQNRFEPTKKGNRGYEPQCKEYTNLVDTGENIYLATDNLAHYQQKVKPSHMFKWGKNSRDTSKRCVYHKEVGHTTEECHQLKDEIKNLIKLGHLHQWVRMPTRVLGLPVTPRQSLVQGA
ncbi:uncharacterized protein LOC133833096 [Humulus lupulus]|uniref:uncharacterized protein LOC133833096 n=1 Tax=Humulus lupulus TaxID=3486 RepID=UPI002B413F1B|nr:uncharacterized protein LOC133833096 [Humulus lupulus]